MALAIVSGVFVHHDRRGTPTVPAPSELQGSDTEPAPSLPPEAVSEPQRRLLAPVPTTAPRARKPAESPVAERLDEPSLIDKLHDLAASDPPQSLKVAREALARFPDSPHAPEFRWNVVKALANMERYQEAEEEARSRSIRTAR
jgi:hypothetical protein